MLFNDLPFWYFFPAFFVLYWATRGTARLWVSALGSYLFYGWWDVRFLPLIAALTAINYWCGLALAKPDRTERFQKRVVTLSVVCSLGILGFFKYFNFFVNSAVEGLRLAGLGVEPSTLQIILPVGISFYTFQTMSYTIDLYRGHIEVERSWLRFGVFVAFFPQLVAGPIVRASSMLPQLKSDRTVTADDLRIGVNRILWGMVLKVVVADNLASVSDRAFTHPELHTASFLAIGVLFYTFQIYGDFAGYSLMARGFARTLGFEFEQNFNRPYFASSLSDFWRRWHISLSSWLRDYLYIPLGGNRAGPRRTLVNLMLTMLLGGLWHGAAWTFVAWGAVHGGGLVAQRWIAGWAGWLRGRARTTVGWGLTLATVVLGWIMFRAQSFADGWAVISKLATLDGLGASGIPSKFLVVKGVLLIAALVVAEATTFRFDYRGISERSLARTFVFWWVCMVAIAFAGMFEGSAFIYFQF